MVDSGLLGLDVDWTAFLEDLSTSYFIFWPGFCSRPTSTEHLHGPFPPVKDYCNLPSIPKAISTGPWYDCLDSNFLILFLFDFRPQRRLYTYWFTNNRSNSYFLFYCEFSDLEDQAPLRIWPAPTLIVHFYPSSRLFAWTEGIFSSGFDDLVGCLCWFAW